ncbi:MAG: hypothetical protein ACYSSI_06120 [Planctomycetota bacterium]|jgi:hypothetical protein
MVYLLDANGTLLQSSDNPTLQNNDWFSESIATVGGNIFIGSCGEGSCHSAAYLFDGLTGNPAQKCALTLRGTKIYSGIGLTYYSYKVVKYMTFNRNACFLSPYS